MHVLNWAIKKIMFWHGCIQHSKIDEGDKSVEDRVKNHGFKFKEHKVVTEDQYVLTMH